MKPIKINNEFVKVKVKVKFTQKQTKNKSKEREREKGGGKEFLNLPSSFGVRAGGISTCTSLSSRRHSQSPSTDTRKLHR